MKTGIQTIAHQVSLTGIGGVQKSFIDYLSYVRLNRIFRHRVYGLYPVDSQYGNIPEYGNICRNPLDLMRFLGHIRSSQSVVHFYNNLGSRTVAKLLRLSKPRHLVFHERGAAWNIPTASGETLRTNTDKAVWIIVNSNATRILLNQKFGISENKLKVIYNGVISSGLSTAAPKHRKDATIRVGFLGRFDTPKGIHILIDAARILRKRTDIVFILGGDGPLDKALRKRASDLPNIQFKGRITDPISFLSDVDIVAVPSIREPLGNVIIEAGVCSKPVVAAQVDGIPEIISDNKTGLLIAPSKPLSNLVVDTLAAPFPECVVDLKTARITDPLELSPTDLADALTQLADDIDLRMKLGHCLRHTVIQRFTVEKYTRETDALYSEILNGL